MIDRHLAAEAIPVPAGFADYQPTNEESMTTRRPPANETRQEFRTAATDIGFEIRQLTKAVQEFRDRADAIKQRLLVEARVVRQQCKAKRTGGRQTRDAITVLHGPEGRSTRKGHGKE